MECSSSGINVVKHFENFQKFWVIFSLLDIFSMSKNNSKQVKYSSTGEMSNTVDDED